MKAQNIEALREVASRSGNPLRIALIFNTPTPYRVPALKLLAEDPQVHLDVIYCAAPHIDSTLGDAAHGFKPYFLGGEYQVFERRFMHNDFSVVSLLKQLRPDVVITTGYIPTFLYAFLWAWLKRVPHVVMTDGTLDSERNLSWLHRVVRRFVFRRSQAFVGACEGSLDLFRRYGVEESRLFMAPLAIDNARFAAMPVPEERVDFLFCGRFVAHKRPLFAIDVAAETARRLGRRVSVDFVGAGVLEAKIRDYAASRTDLVDVRLRGYASQQELPARYAAARIFLFPSEWDPWGVVSNEACAAGTPVIISPHCGSARELVRDGENGFIRVLDVGQWAEAATQLLKDEALCRRMGARGQNIVADYSWKEAGRAIKSAVQVASGRMPLLIVSLMRPQGTTGVQTHVKNFRAYLDSEGQTYRLLTPFDAARSILYPLIGARRILERCAPALSVWLYRAGHAMLLRNVLSKALRAGNECVIYAQCPVSAGAALAVRRHAGQRVVLIVHFNVSQADEWAGKGMIAPDGRVHRGITRFEEQLLPKLDALVFVSAFMCDQLLARIPVLKDVPHEVIPNFVRDPAGAVSASEISGDLIAIGTLEPRKNQQYLLDILAAAKNLGHLLRLTIVGDGPDRQSLQARARSLELLEQVHFAGFVPDAARMLGQHRACIHVARIENLPITLIEAMAWGRPVFASNVGGIPEVLIDGEQGRLLPLDNADAAARILCAAFADAACMQSFGAAARARFMARFEHNSVGAALRTCLLDRVARSAPRRHVVIVQRRMTHYREPLFERLRVALAREGVQLRVVCGLPSIVEQLRHDSGDLPWAEIVPTRAFLHDMLVWQNLRSYIRGADMVIVTQENRFLYNYLLPLLHRSTLWAFWGHGRNFRASGWQSLGDWFKRWYARHAGWWFAYTQRSAEVVRQAGYPAERISVLNNALDDEGFEQALASLREEDVEARLSAWGVHGRNVCVMLGSLASEKRLPFMLAAAQLIRARVPDFELLIVGDGPQRAFAEAAQARNGAWIHWTGALGLRDKAMVLSRARLLLNPGMLGLVMLDSFMAGVPMVACDLPWHSPEAAYLEHDRNGVVTADDVATYADEVVTLLQDEARRLRLREACLADAKRYTLDAMVEHFAGGIQAALREAGK